MNFKKYLWGPAQNNGLVKLRARPRRILSEEKSWPKHYLSPIAIKETCPRSNSSSDITKSGSRARPNHCSSSSKHIKKNKTQNISWKAATTTLNVSQPLSWPH